MKNEGKKEKISLIIWFVSIWLLALNWFMIKSENPWKLLFYDICYGETESTIHVFKFLLTFSWSIIVIALILYMFMQGKIRFVMRIRLHKVHKEINLGITIKKYIKEIALIHAVIAVCVILMLNFADVLRSYKEWKGDITIAHAGGDIDGNTYTNSPEAIYKNYENGQRTFEIDMVLTADNKLACIHDWDVDFQKGREAGTVPTSEEFLSYLIKEKYTPILFEDLCHIMNERPDMWLITDSKYTSNEEIHLEFQEIVRVAQELNMEHILDRVIVQIYHENMYETIKEIYPFQSWIFTLYQRWKGDVEEFYDIVRFCVKKDIPNITMNKKRVSREIVDIANKYKVDVYAHTINKMEEAKESLDVGIKGIYTDRILPRDIDIIIAKEVK